MKFYINIFFVLSLLLPPFAANAATDADTTATKNTREVRDRNVMLNAVNDKEPRQIDIGLPSAPTTLIFEDGLPVSFRYWPHLPSFSWHSGLSEESVSMMSLGESAIRYGDVSYIVTSKSRHATDKFRGFAKYGYNHYGKHSVDLNISGPMGHGWGYTVGQYIELDPGSNNFSTAYLQTKQEIFKAGINKKLRHGGMSLLYTYGKRQGISDRWGVFVYHAKDGSTSRYNGFIMGQDQYYPDDVDVRFIDVKTGQQFEKSVWDASVNSGHQVIFSLDERLWDAVDFSLRSKYKYGVENYLYRNPSGVTFATADDGYSYQDRGTDDEHGQVYAGYVDSRYMRYYVGDVHDFLTNAEFSGKALGGMHGWRIGADAWFNATELQMMNSTMAQEACANPKALLVNGSMFHAYNTSAEYYDGTDTRLAVYGSDDMKFGRLSVTVGARAQLKLLSGESACADNEPANVRYDGWTLQDGVLTPFSGHFFEGALTANVRYRVLGGFGLTGEGVLNRTGNNLEDYGAARMPDTKPVVVKMARLGAYYNNHWLELVSQLSYISQSNYKTRTQFQHILTRDCGTMTEGSIETLTVPVTYGVRTFGWTTDAVVNMDCGFSFHGLMTLQDPQYTGFVFEPTFSDGVSEVHDFSGRSVVGMSIFLLELDPSFTWPRGRVWMSARYFSRQPINKTNSLYFKGRWETFAGFSYKISTHVTFDLNLTNLLNQLGASGSIGPADLVEAADLDDRYDDYLMSGKFIRPFTVEAAIKISI